MVGLLPSWGHRWLASSVQLPRSHCRLAAVFYLGWWGGLVGGVLVFCLLVVSVFACVIGVLADSFVFVFVCGSRPSSRQAGSCRLLRPGSVRVVGLFLNGWCSLSDWLFCLCVAVNCFLCGVVVMGWLGAVGGRVVKCVGKGTAGPYK